MEKVVLDASALLAALLRERGGDQIKALLVDPGMTVLMSALNWSEVFDRLLREGFSEQEVDRILSPLNIEIVDFTRQQARMAAGYRIAAPALSLGDRACLAAADLYHATAWTADRQWSRAKLPVKIEVIR
jgi:PIN domain nuclease of toxin-antitoxin system